MRNPAGESSKSSLVESLLRLGDIARNSHVGEVQVALGKAKLFIDKYGLIQFDGRYQQMVEKLAAFLRGEKVTREDEPQQEQTRSSRTSWWEAREEMIRKAREQRKAERRQRTQERRARKREERARTRATAGAGVGAKASGEHPSYTRPHIDYEIIWLWKLASVPKRGKAGERWKAYYPAKTIREFLQRGGRWSDVKWNIQHGYMRADYAER